MLENLRQLPRYRGLIQSLVSRELKARYRGSVLGFFWSFVNPLLLLMVYTFVFAYVMPPAQLAEIPNFALFLFCGLLPWTWFQASLVESSNILISGGNLIKKVMFPAEILPIVTVLANLVHFLFGLPILFAFLIYFDAPLELSELAVVSGGRVRPAPAERRPRADTLGAHGSFPGHQGHSRERDDAVVFRDADHLLLEVCAGGDSAVPRI